MQRYLFRSMLFSHMLRILLSAADILAADRAIAKMRFYMLFERGSLHESFATVRAHILLSVFLMRLRVAL